MNRPDGHAHDPMECGGELTPSDAPTLWAVHVRGSDDIHAMRSRRDAETFKGLLDNLDATNAHREHYPLSSAVIVEWPGTREEHTQSLREQANED